MGRRTPFGPFLLILLLLPTPALCAICTAEGCAMETAAEDHPMEKAPRGCCAAMQAMAHETPVSHGTPTDRETPTGHDCASSQPMAAAAGGDCCAAAAGRDAGAPTAAPTTDALPLVVPPGLSDAPDTASGAAGGRRATAAPASSRALFTLHSVLLI